MKGNRFWQDYIVAYVDVLGQKEEFKKIEDYLVGEVPQEKLYEVAENTVLVVELLRKEFKKLFKGYTAESESKLKVKVEDKAEYDAMRESSPIKFQFSSDSMLAYVPLRTKKYLLNDLIAIQGIFGTVGGLLLMTLAINSAYRAGIELGIGTEFEDGGIYGPALGSAYTLESKTANYPRIVIGEKLKKYLDNYSKGHLLAPDHTKRYINGCKRMASVCLKMIDKDQDEYLILDYLGEDFKNRFKFDPSGNVYVKAIKAVKKKRDSGDIRVAAKYEKLLDYFELKLS